MQRDMDLIRKILLAVEADPHGTAPQEIEIEGYTEGQISYHIWLMGQGGLMQVQENANLLSKSPSAIPLSITWEGYEFAAASKNEGTFASVVSHK